MSEWMRQEVKCVMKTDVTTPLNRKLIHQFCLSAVTNYCFNLFLLLPIVVGFACRFFLSSVCLHSGCKLATENNKSDKIRNEWQTLGKLFSRAKYENENDWSLPHHLFMSIFDKKKSVNFLFIDFFLIPFFFFRSNLCEMLSAENYTPSVTQSQSEEDFFSV